MARALAEADAQAARKRRWGDLGVRLASAAVLGPLALLCVWLGGVAYAAILVAGLAGIGWEWGVMCRWRAPPLVAGLAYACAAVGSLWVLRRAGVLPVMFLLCVVWCSDVGAYVVGRWLGGPRLAPRISPGKTWSGAAGGLVAAMIGGVLVAGANGGWAGLAAGLSIVSQVGDLAESAAKRHYGVKDSGWLIPGHGGLLDRLDGLIAAAIPAAMVLLFHMAPGAA